MSARRGIVRLLFGKTGGRRFVLRAGQIARVGRGEDVDVSLDHDRAVERAHCMIGFDGRAFRVFDTSTTGTLVGGAPWSSGLVPAGQYVLVGHTTLRLFAEDLTPPLAPDRDPARLERAARALAKLEAIAAERPLFGVLDAARSERVVTLLDEAVDDSRSLYEGPQGDALADCAPHLVRFEPGSGLLRRVVEEGFGLGWGVFLTSPEPLRVVRRHLRRFLMVRAEPTLERYYFRFYDPRVLRDFLPIATARQRGNLFGPFTAESGELGASPCAIEAFHFEGEDGALVTDAFANRRPSAPATQADAPAP